ncbi:BTB/POZ domain-containing protein 10 [Platysternon megacephalum]|uniref:BTB/POZ domain-containing protein 10 n=1 Tax=Platysternon megacephalum TaxID=55544 RepID=A0A4D9DZP6_9SAUR|nr:BTB/POZ domain-containing protein 10 [Platysternon megacephalum]
MGVPERQGREWRGRPAGPAAGRDVLPSIRDGPAVKLASTHRQALVAVPSARSALPCPAEKCQALRDPGTIHSYGERDSDRDRGEPPDPLRFSTKPCSFPLRTGPERQGGCAARTPPSSGDPGSARPRAPPSPEPWPHSRCGRLGKHGGGWAAMASTPALRHQPSRCCSVASSGWSKPVLRTERQG